MLGAIGPVFGNAFETLEKVKGCLAADGVVLIDDAYYEDGAERDDTGIAYRSELLDQIGRAGMELADEKLADGNESRSDSFGIEFGHIVRRCSELADKFPDKKCIFEEYVETQRAEYDSIMNDLTCSTLVIKLRHPAL